MNVDSWSNAWLRIVGRRECSLLFYEANNTEELLCDSIASSGSEGLSVTGSMKNKELG